MTYKIEQPKPCPMADEITDADRIDHLQKWLDAAQADQYGWADYMFTTWAPVRRQLDLIIRIERRAAEARAVDQTSVCPDCKSDPCQCPAIVDGGL